LHSSGKAITAGVCAAAGAKAAVHMLCGYNNINEVEIPTSDGSRRIVPIDHCVCTENSAAAEVTNCDCNHADTDTLVKIIVTVEWDDSDEKTVPTGEPTETPPRMGLQIPSTVTAFWSNTDKITLHAGEGVGTATHKCKEIPSGDPAINKESRDMIIEAVSELTDRSMQITVSIPEGESIANNALHQKHGIKGGLLL
tara:strand:- start:18183 stop:18773 length:591 start_codon:yes stop_codon:yes gene_type:complete